MQEIDSVTFDAGGTLLSAWPSVGSVYANAARAAGFGDADSVKLDRRFAIAWKADGEFDYSKGAWAGVVARCFDGLVPRHGSPELFRCVYRAFESPAAWKVFPDAVETLVQLKRRGLRTAIISNWDERLAPLLHAMDLARYFDAIIVSLDVGYRKPAPEIFQRALSALGTPAHRTLHIGDSVVEDVDGATRAGMRAVLLDRTIDNDKQGSAHRTVSALSELLTIVRSSDRRGDRRNAR